MIVACVLVVVVLLAGLPAIHVVTGLTAIGAPAHGTNVHAYKVFHHAGSTARVGVLGVAEVALMAAVLVLMLSAERIRRAARAVRGTVRLMLTRGAGARISDDDCLGSFRYCLFGDQTPCSSPILGSQGVFHIHARTEPLARNSGRGKTWDEE